MFRNCGERREEVLRASFSSSLLDGQKETAQRQEADLGNSSAAGPIQSARYIQDSEIEDGMQTQAPGRPAFKSPVDRAAYYAGDQPVKHRSHRSEVDQGAEQSAAVVEFRVRTALKKVEVVA